MCPASLKQTEIKAEALQLTVRMFIFLLGLLINTPNLWGPSVQGRIHPTGRLSGIAVEHISLLLFLVSMVTAATLHESEKAHRRTEETYVMLIQKPHVISREERKPKQLFWLCLIYAN